MKRFLRMTSLPLPNIQAYERGQRQIHVPVLFKRLNSSRPPQKGMRESWRSTEKKREPFLLNLSAVGAQRKELLCIYRSIREIKYRSDVLCTLIRAVFENLPVPPSAAPFPRVPACILFPVAVNLGRSNPKITSCFNRPIQTRKLPSGKAKDHQRSLTKCSPAGWAFRKFWSATSTLKIF